MKDETGVAWLGGTVSCLQALASVEAALDTGRAAVSERLTSIKAFPSVEQFCPAEPKELLNETS